MKHHEISVIQAYSIIDKNKYKDKIGDNKENKDQATTKLKRSKDKAKRIKYEPKSNRNRKKDKARLIKDETKTL